MQYKELIAMLDRDDAAQSVYNLLREGLTNAVAIPEVETDADQAAHHLLGCTNYMALLAVYTTADDLRPDEPGAAQVVSNMADGHLRVLTDAVLWMRAPVGPNICKAAPDAQTD